MAGAMSNSDAACVTKAGAQISCDAARPTETMLGVCVVMVVLFPITICTFQILENGNEATVTNAALAVLALGAVTTSFGTVRD